MTLAAAKNYTDKQVQDNRYALTEKDKQEIADMISTGGGSSEEWKLIRTITIPEDITTDTSGVNFAYATADAPENGVWFGFDTDENGNTFECTELLIYTENASHTSSIGNAAMSFEGSEPIYGGYGIAVAGCNGNNKATNGMTKTEIISDGYVFTLFATFGGGAANTTQTAARREFAKVSIFKSMRAFITNGQAHGFNPNSKFIIYGR